ncbi:hypothetical protein D3C85_668570 [compost metagenome]
MVAIGVGVVGQQQFARHHDVARRHVGDDVVIGGHWRYVRYDFDRQGGAGQIAIVVADGEADVFGDQHRGGFLRNVSVFTGVEIDLQGTAVVGGNVQCVVHGVERAMVEPAAEVQGTLIGVAARIVGVRGAVHRDGLDEAAIGAECTALAQQRAGHRCTVHRAGQHRVELVEVGHHHRIGVGVAAAVIGQRIEVGVAHTAAQADRVVLDVVGIEEGFQRGFVGGADFLAGGGLAVGEEVADVLRTGQFARGVERGLHGHHGRVVVGPAVRGEAGQQCLGGRDIDPHRGHVGSAAAEGDELHFHIAEVIVFIQQGTDGLLGQGQARQARHAGWVGHAAGDVEHDQQVGIDLHRRHRAIRCHRLGHVIDNVDHDGAGAAVAQRIGGFVGEAFTQAVRPVVGIRRGFRCRGQGVGVAAVGVEQDLPVGAGGAADQGVGERAAGTRDRSDQGPGRSFTGIARIAAGDRTGGQVLAALVQVEGFFIDRHVAIGVGLDNAVGHINGDGRGAFITIGVAHGVGERIRGPGNADRIRVAVIHRVAVGIERQVTVGAVDRVTQPADGRGRGIAAGAHADHRRRTIGAVDVIAQHTDIDRAALRYR